MNVLTVILGVLALVCGLVGAARGNKSLTGFGIVALALGGGGLWLVVPNVTGDPGTANGICWFLIIAGAIGLMGAATRPGVNW